MGAKRSVKSLLLLAMTLAAGGFVASALGIHELPSAQETHGKLPVILNEKFSLHFPTGTTGVTWSPDGSILAVSSNYGMKLNTYDGSGRPLSEFKSQGNLGAYLNNFAFLSGASQVLFPIEATTDADAALDIRDVATGRILQTITRSSTRIRANYFAVSPDQRRFAIANSYGKNVVTYGSDDGIEWHELSVAKEHITYADKGKQFWHGDISLCFFPDGKSLAVGKADGYFAVVDSTTGETIKEFKAYDAPGIDDNVDGLAVSPKGDLILIGLHPVAISPPLATPEAMAWEGSNHTVASVWRVSDGKQIAGLPDKKKLIRQAVWDPKNRFVAFVDTDSLVLWNPEAPGENFIRIKLPGLSASLAISRDGKSLAVAGGNSVIVYNIKDNIQKT
jgi:WD40 repeat protein